MCTFSFLDHAAIIRCLQSWKQGYRFFFYPADLLNEPPHVHVRKAGNEAKFWLDPVRRARNVGYRPHELRQVERLVNEYEAYLLTCWQQEMQNL